MDGVLAQELFYPFDEYLICEIQFVAHLYVEISCLHLKLSMHKRKVVWMVTYSVTNRSRILTVDYFLSGREVRIIP